MIRYVFLFTIVFLSFSGCRTDYDIADVAPVEFLDSGENHEHLHEHSDNETPGEHDHNGHTDVKTVDEHSIDEHVEASHAGHDHASGTRNHGTQWFFNQPWAAPFIWGKLFRDSVIFLGLAVAVFFFSNRKRRKR
ncbi:MAG: hypothetical protein KAH31_00845 [Candidatus Sabulitectum sp.]|nr:hypothetical protein [Candidatus Sabulitectum sp.]